MGSDATVRVPGYRVNGRASRIVPQGFLVDESMFLVEKERFWTDKSGFLTREETSTLENAGFWRKNAGKRVEKVVLSVEKSASSMKKDGSLVKEPGFSTREDVPDTLAGGLAGGAFEGVEGLIVKGPRGSGRGRGAVAGRPEDEGGPVFPAEKGCDGDSLEHLDRIDGIRKEDVFQRWKQLRDDVMEKDAGPGKKVIVAGSPDGEVQGRPF